MMQVSEAYIERWLKRFEEAPLLVFWESTKACPLACRHCRAEAIRNPLPGELSLDEGKQLIRQVGEFGEPKPTLIITGGTRLPGGIYSSWWSMQNTRAYP